MSKKILFLTGTRAEYGKLKPLMLALEESDAFDCYIFATGMHTLSRYGYTVDQIIKEGFQNVHIYMNQIHGEPMDLILSNTVAGLSRYVNECKPDMIVVHGDRVEAMAGAIVGALNNILVAHIEGGELSGTIDGLIRHSVSKLSHIHFVANEEAAIRLKQLGEIPKSIYNIGSPDIDAMLSPDLPGIDDVKKRYEITYNNYAIVLFHPVTTETEELRKQADILVEALIRSERKYVVIYPNNDEGCDHIFGAYKKLEGNRNFKMFPSIRFEYFLTLLKNADFIVGNSSVGIRETPVYGVYSVNVGSRQRNRFSYKSILNVSFEVEEIIEAIRCIGTLPILDPCFTFGRGGSAQQFRRALEVNDLWETPKQKEFMDLIMSH